MEQIEVDMDKKQIYAMATCICSDIADYIKNHKSEFEAFLEQKNKKHYTDDFLNTKNEKKY